MIYWFSITRHWRQWANGQPLDISAEPLALWQYHWRNEDAITWSALDISIVVGQRCESWAGTFKPAGIVRWFKQISNTGSIFIALISEMVEVKCWFRWEFFIWLCSLVFFLPYLFRTWTTYISYKLHISVPICYSAKQAHRGNYTVSPS